MEPNEKFAQWAALFVDAMNKSNGADAVTEQPAPAPVIQYAGITSEACDLLQAVDAGGIPAFVTANIMEIARDNGIDVDDLWTPNAIVEAIRNKAVAIPPSSSD